MHNHAIILPAVTIGQGPVVAGNPARVIRQLDAGDPAGKTKEQV